LTPIEMAIIDVVHATMMVSFGLLGIVATTVWATARDWPGVRRWARRVALQKLHARARPQSVDRLEVQCQTDSRAREASVAILCTSLTLLGLLAAACRVAIVAHGCDPWSELLFAACLGVLPVCTYFTAALSFEAVKYGLPSEDLDVHEVEALERDLTSQPNDRAKNESADEKWVNLRAS
jgi:hypothetical protein